MSYSWLFRKSMERKRDQTRLSELWSKYREQLDDDVYCAGAMAVTSFKIHHLLTVVERKALEKLVRSICAIIFDIMVGNELSHIEVSDTQRKEWAEHIEWCKQIEQSLQKN